MTYRSTVRFCNIALVGAARHTPRLGGDRLGCSYCRLGGLVVGVSLLRRYRLTISSPNDRSQITTRTTQTPIPQFMSLAVFFHGLLRHTRSDETPWRQEKCGLGRNFRTP